MNTVTSTCPTSSAPRATTHALRVSATRPIDVSVCIPNWNCRELLRACLESLRDQPHGVRLEIIVVDNASTDGAADMVAHDFPEIMLVRNSNNLRFHMANNQAA